MRKEGILGWQEGRHIRKVGVLGRKVRSTRN
jgi:hypothetical protein